MKRTGIIAVVVMALVGVVIAIAIAHAAPKSAIPGLSDAKQFDLRKDILSSDAEDYVVSGDVSSFDAIACAREKQKNGYGEAKCALNQYADEIVASYKRGIVITGKFKSQDALREFGQCRHLIGDFTGFNGCFCNPESELDATCSRIFAKVSWDCNSQAKDCADKLKEMPYRVEDCLWGYDVKKPNEFMCKITCADLQSKDGPIHVVNPYISKPLAVLDLKVSFGADGYKDTAPAFALKDLEHGIIKDDATLCGEYPTMDKSLKLQQNYKDIIRPQQQ